MHRSAAEQAVRWRLLHGGEGWAGLNFRDCFSYALAKLLGEPLLYKARTSRGPTSMPSRSTSDEGRRFRSPGGRRSRD